LHVTYAKTSLIETTQVSVALALIGAITWLKAALLILSQILAGIAAAGIVSALFPGNLAVRTRLGPDTSIVRGLFIEMLLTAELIFCIFMLAAEKHKATFLAPIGIGLALFIAELAGKSCLSFTIHATNMRRRLFHWRFTKPCTFFRP
jgi:glycerol uptake facilitator-like aquaporin